MTEANLKMHFPQFVLKYALALGIIGQVTHSSADIFSEKDQMLKPSAFSTYSGYLKKKKIGEGTYANVHVGIALDKSKEVKVAIKSIKAGLFTNGIDMSAVREV